MRRMWLRVVVLVGLSALCQSGYAQQTAGTPVFRTQSRLVFEDVTVMDSHGRPVHGLPASAFHVFDRDEPQSIRSFEEGGAEFNRDAPEAASLPVGTFTNAIPANSPSASEVLLIDTDDMELTDQMFVLEQLRKSIDTMPAGLQAAVFAVRNGRAIPLLGMTTDKAALKRAVGEALPAQTHAVDSKFQSAANQLMTISALLQQIPGRKNILWFAGEFPLVSTNEGEQNGGAAGSYSERENTIHQIQEALAESRISVYPVDVRGVLTNGLAQPSASTGGGSPPQTFDLAARTRRQVVATPQGANDSDRRSEMRKLAEVTGGKAYFLNNLSQEITEAFDLGARAYTLTFKPSSYVLDQSWHRVKVTVDGDYIVSYRRGYLATFTGDTNEPSRNRLVAGGMAVAEAGVQNPIFFEVRIAPTSVTEPGGKPTAFSMRAQFRVPASQLAFSHQQGVWTNDLVVTSYAYDGTGKVRAGKMQVLTTHLTDAQYEAAREKNVSTQQQFAVPKDAKYLLMYMRDKASQRAGSLLLQVRAISSLPAEMPEHVTTVH